MNNFGKVYLVGAGIGSEDYITVRAKRVIEEADVIVYDRLLNPKLLVKKDDTTEFINVAKESSNHLFSQDEINDILVKKSYEGKTVVRLKGGDPYVFGRGGEEAEYLVDRGIEVEVIPGITSGIAGLCFAGIPATHRDYSSSLHLITGHKKDEADLDYDTLSKLHGTLVFYMGLGNLPIISSSLIKSGKNEETACAVISHAGYADQKVLASTLKNIVNDIKNTEFKSPSLIVVGDVVNLRKNLNFFENRPLFGKNIVVTRSREQSSSLVNELNSLGANVIEVPTISIKPINHEKLKYEQNNLKKYTHIIFTSVNGVKIFMKSLLENQDTRALSNSLIFAIGSETSEELLKYGIRADFIPSKYVAEILYDEIKDNIKSTDVVLLPRALKARPLLFDKLSEICKVVELPIYDTKREEIGHETIQELETSKIDYITFTSSSTVVNFVKSTNDDIIENVKKAKLISIGPITSETAESYGFKVYKEAEIHNIENLVKILLEE